MDQKNLQVSKAPEGRVSTLLQTDAIRQRFVAVLGKRANSFMSSIVSAVNSNAQLLKCEPMSIISAAAIAAAMDLPINPSLGFAYIVPYGDKAQFQVGWKGFVQLAMRSGQYKTINLAKVYDGQVRKHNEFTGEMEFDTSIEPKGNPVGYVLYFKLLNGFEKYFYMTAKACHEHGKRYSKSYAKNFGQWVDDFDGMSLKTVCKMGLSKYGVLSIDMQKALETDQAEVAESGEALSFPDAEPKAEDKPVEKPAPKTKSAGLSAIVAASTAEAEITPPVDEAPPPSAPPEDMPI